MRNTPQRISPDTYPIAATATAPAYDYRPEAAPTIEEQTHKEPLSAGQQALFAMPVSDPRVIAFESLTNPAQRESIRARAAGIVRPAPLKTEKIEAPRPRSAAKPRANAQRRLDFLAQEQVLAPPQSSILCDAPVAPPTLRIRAALIDAILIAIGSLVAAALFRFLGGELSVDKHFAPVLLLALATVPLSYKLLWTCAGRDTIGMRAVGLQLVDFDGNRPSQARRFQRLLGTLLSVLAAGLGVIWVFVDEDGLAWHDHISGTFPSIVSRD